jgi:hypothetical protein
MKLTVALLYFAYHNRYGSKIYRDNAKIFLSYRQNWCQVKTHKHAVLWLAFLLFILTSRIHFSSSKFRNSEFH